MMEVESEHSKKKTTIVTNDLLAGYIAEFADDVKLTNYNLREKSLTCSSIWAKWLAYLYKEKENLQRIADAKHRVMQKKSANVKATDSILKQKIEEKLSDNDETMKKLNELQRKTQTNIDYIERALNVLQNFGFTVKNSIEAFKLNFEH